MFNSHTDKFRLQRLTEQICLFITLHSLQMLA